MERSKEIELLYDEALQKAAQYGITEDMLDSIRNFKSFPSIEELRKESGLEEEKEMKKELIRKK